MNILILSAGTRNKVVQYFKKALTDDNGGRLGKVVATDMSRVAPAVYEADRFYQVPRMTEPGYIDQIFDICRKEEITAVLSLIDPELSLLAEHEAEFRERGVTVIGSSYELCEMSLDKMRMYEWLTAHGYATAASYADKDAFYADVDAGKLSYPVFVKPIRGSASIAISRAVDRETVDLLFAHADNLMVQEYLNGQEIGADVYIDLVSGEIVSIFTKKKLVMRAGETDKAVSFRDEALFDLIRKFVGEAGYRGQIDIDLFAIGGTYYISEVNPRFGGGYPHAYECGCDHMKLIVNNLRGAANAPRIGDYQEGIHMMKYSEVMIRAEVQPC
ncbi:MAG: ATP-grasp domain-containing protein [Butyrivibrio sp.]|nr:ATP-grasp domain-containing protein [Butyrivibrio sp.]